MDDFKKLLKDAKEISKLFGDENSGENNNSDLNISNIVNAMEMMKSIRPENTEEACEQRLIKSFDDDLIPRNVKILKSMVPYFEKGQAKNIAVAVKVIELFSVMEKYDDNLVIKTAGLDEIDDNNGFQKNLSMLNAIKAHMDESGKQTADMMIKFMSVSNLMKKM